MSTYARILSFAAVTLGLGCGDSTGETTDGSTSAGEATGTTTSPTTSPVDTGQTDTTGPDPTVATSIDSTGSSTTSGGDAADIEVSIEGQVLASGATYSIATPVDVGVMGDAVTVNVENVGGADLAIAGVSLPTGATAHFVLDDSGLDGSLTPGASTSFTVVFSPSNGGRKQVDVLIESDDPDEAQHTLRLDATSTPNTWRDLAPATLPPARFNAAMAATDDGRVLLFGGRLADGTRVADTWLFDVEAGAFTELAPPESPSARDASAMAFGDDTLVLFGGNETSGPGGAVTPLADTWIFDLAAETWTELTPPASPSVRFQHAMAPAGNGLVILQGGRSEFMMELADSWAFDPATEAWAELGPPTDPGPRSAFAFAADNAGRLFMVGGSTDSTTFVDQTWIYAVATNVWSSAAPAALGTLFNNAAAWLEGDSFVAFGGKPDCCSNPVPGTWVYEVGPDAWTDLAPPTEPPSRFSHRMVSVGGNKAIMFGGLLLNADLASATAETWEYVGPQ